jgi:hypothetical protein
MAPLAQVMDAFLRAQGSEEGGSFFLGKYRWAGWSGRVGKRTLHGIWAPWLGGSVLPSTQSEQALL